MLRVEISLRPSWGGREESLAFAEITNDGTGTEDIGNYDIRAGARRMPVFERRDGQLVLVNMPPGTSPPRYEGRVEGFPRLEKNALELLYEALGAVLGEAQES